MVSLTFARMGRTKEMTMAWPRVACVALTLMALFFASACATGGRSFDHTKVRTLEFGALSSGSYQSVFGEPWSTSTTTNADGKFENVSFLYTKKTMEKSGLRVLKLEFRDETLNAWHYLSTFEEDRTVADEFQAAKILRGIHRKNNVETILGKPSGKARCPSLLASPHCTGTELWAWAIIHGVYDRATKTCCAKTRRADIFVVFDNNEIVTQVITQDFTTPSQ